MSALTDNGNNNQQRALSHSERVWLCVLRYIVLNCTSLFFRVVSKANNFRVSKIISSTWRSNKSWICYFFRIRFWLEKKNISNLLAHTLTRLILNRMMSFFRFALFRVLFLVVVVSSQPHNKKISTDLVWMIFFPWLFSCRFFIALANFKFARKCCGNEMTKTAHDCNLYIAQNCSLCWKPHIFVRIGYFCMAQIHTDGMLMPPCLMNKQKKTHND